MDPITLGWSDPVEFEDIYEPNDYLDYLDSVLESFGFSESE